MNGRAEKKTGGAKRVKREDSGGKGGDGCRHNFFPSLGKGKSNFWDCEERGGGPGAIGGVGGA